MDVQTSPGLKSAADAVLHGVVSATPGVPGVVAVATDRNGVIYEGVAGKRALGQDADMTADTVFAIFSCTKAIAGTVVLKLVEDGKIDLDAPAKTYAPDLAKAQVLDGFDTDGTPRLRAPKRDITTRMLMTHTAGFGYEFFNKDMLDYAAATKLASPITATKASLGAPLLFDPGERWEYGINIDWCGQVAEGAGGRRLGEMAKSFIFEPLGMHDTAFTMTSSMRERMAHIHQRDEAGALTPLMEFELTAEPEVHMGGHGLYSTAPDYAKFIRMYLADGAGDHGRVLKAETVAMAAKNHLGALKIKALPGVIPSLSNDAEFFPGMPKSWALSFMINDEDAPTGRKAGSLAWAGLPNLYFWIDRETGVGGIWATQIFPFADPASVGGYLEFETAVYRNR